MLIKIVCKFFKCQCLKDPLIISLWLYFISFCHSIRPLSLLLKNLFSEFSPPPTILTVDVERGAGCSQRQHGGHCIAVKTGVGRPPKTQKEWASPCIYSPGPARLDCRRCGATETSHFVSFKHQFKTKTYLQFYFKRIMLHFAPSKYVKIGTPPRGLQGCYLRHCLGNKWDCQSGGTRTTRILHTSYEH